MQRGSNRLINKLRSISTPSVLSWSPVLVVHFFVLQVRFAPFYTGHLNSSTAPVNRDVVARRRPLPQLILLKRVGAVAEDNAEGCGSQSENDETGMTGTVVGRY